MMLTPLQLPSIHHNPSCDGCAHDAEKGENAKREFGRKKRSQAKTKRHLF